MPLLPRIGLSLALGLVMARTTPATTPATPPAAVEAPEVLGASPTPEVPDLDLDAPGISMWTHSIRLSGGGGFKDNPQLSSLNPQPSGFATLSAEGSLFRLPVDGPEVSLLGTLDHIEYFDRELDPETMALTDARWASTVADRWTLSAQSGYLYLSQVFDASEIEGTPLVVQAEGHTVYLRPAVSYALGAGWHGEVEYEVSRQWLADPLDSFFDMAPKAGLVRRLRPDTELGLSYRFRDRRFDSRTPTDLFGDRVVGRLRIAQHEIEGVWRRSWGRARAWRFSARAGWVHSSDNGVGFLDYDRFQGVGALRWVAPRWEVRGEVRSRWYYYGVQQADPLAGTWRRRWDVAWSLRTSWKVREKVQAYLQYEGESTDENVVAGDYRVNTISAGVEWEL